MRLLTKLRTPVLDIGIRNFHRTAALKWKADPPDWDEKKFLLEEKPWENFTSRQGFGYMPDPHPILDEMFDEPHGSKLKPLLWAMILLGIIPVSIYGWYHEYQEIFVRRYRRPFPKHDFIHGEGIKQRLPYGDGIHTLMFHPYFNFTSKGYETDKDGNPLPPGVYVEE